MKILKITLSLLFLYFIYWAFGDTFFNWLFPFSPDEKKQLITVEGVVPKYTKPYVSAEYISKDCLEYEFSATMTPHKVPTYNGLNLNVKADPKTGYFQTKLPFSGGGWCKWKINRAFVAVGYADVSHLMKDAVPSSGTGLAAFINDAARTNYSDSCIEYYRLQTGYLSCFKHGRRISKRNFLTRESGFISFSAEINSRSGVENHL